MKKHIKILFLLTLAAFALAGAPTPLQYKAFRDLALAQTVWPVAPVIDHNMKIDGKLEESAWADAKRIFVTGESFWNRQASSKPYLYSGLKDLIAVWRVLYDTANLYISCDFFDDIHSEGDGKEMWTKTDAVEITLISAKTNIGSGDTVRHLPDSSSYTMRQIWRRFTQRPGLIGMVSTGNQSYRVPGGLTTTGWEKTVSEGSDTIWGVTSAAAPCQDANILKEYPAAWSMEIKVPLSLVFPVVSGSFPATGAPFKMNLRICDDDTSATNDDNLAIGMERFLKPWWTYSMYSVTGGLTDTLGFWGNSYAPTFFLSGRTAPISGHFPAPDEFNLYCGTPAEYYASKTINLAIAVEKTPAPVYGISLSASPNPFYGQTSIRLLLPVAGQADLSIYNALGVKVYEAGRRLYPSGISSVTFSRTVPGIYFVRCNALGKNLTQKLTLLR